MVHASPDAGAVDLVVSRPDGPTEAEFEDVTFASDTGYNSLRPGDHTVDVGPGALEVDITLKPGTATTGYVIGNVTPESGGGGPLGAEVDDAALSAVTTLDATSSSSGNGRGR